MRIVCWDNKEYMRSDGYPWNAWVTPASGGPASFDAGGWWRGLDHVLECKKCRRANKLKRAAIRKQLRDLENEWEYIMGRR